jgi:hypothetical protein
VRAVALDEAVTCDKPLVIFAYQQGGKLTDVTSLKRSVYEVSSQAVRIAESALNLADCPAGTRIGPGVYHADFAALASGGFVIGTHEVRWKFQTTMGGPEFEVRQRFEVLDKTKFPSGLAYIGYAESTELRATNAVFASKTVGEVQVLVGDASRRVELLTGRWFEPRFQQLKIDGRGVRHLMIGPPLIGLSKVEIESGVTGIQASLSEIGLDGLRVYNRHLAGLTDPDDRDDPRVEIERFEGIIFQSLDTFPKGPQDIYLTGVFGYTDPDGGPFGQVPRDISRAVGALALRQLADPYGSDPLTSAPGSVKSAKTRDQAISFFSPTELGGGGGGGAFGGLTGNDFIDELLISYVRPPHYGAV